MDHQQVKDVKPTTKASPAHQSAQQSDQDQVVKQRMSLGRTANLIVWIVVSGITLLPIYWMFLISIRSRVDLFGNYSWLIKGVYWENYKKVLSGDTFGPYMINSIIIATSNAVLVTLLAFLAAYAMSRYRLAGKDNLFFWVLTNRMAPPAVFLLPLFFLFTKVFTLGDSRLFDSHFGLIMLYCVFNLPFAFWLMQGIIDGIPKELDEAAMVDGAGVFRVLTTIILPLSKAGIAVTMMLTWIFAWNEYLFAATLTSVKARTITTGLAEYVTTTGTNWGEMAAVAMLTLLPALLFLGAVQKHIVTGLTFGAVKE